MHAFRVQITQVSENVTNVYMDTSRDSQLPLYLDILFWDIPCEFLEVGVYDTFGACESHAA